MRTMKIFEPSMCCPAGLCGVSVDPELLRVSTVLDTLKKNGVEVGRYNLSSTPGAFVEEAAVQSFLKHFSPSKLPVTTVDGFIVVAGRYPTNEEFASWLDLDPTFLPKTDGGQTKTDCREGEGAPSCCGEDCCKDGVSCC